MKTGIKNNIKKQDKINNTIYTKYVKRILDLLFSLITLIILSPLLIITAILIKVGSKGPILFIQERPGKDMKKFKIYKFRTMVQDAVKYQKIGVEVPLSDSRITPFGKFLRRYKIDEIVQLINVLKGDMSIVGPRPTLSEYIQQYDKWEFKKYDVRPGLTGLSQINGNIYLDRHEKSYYDVKYVNNINFVTDLKIIIKTVAIIICGEKKFVNKINI